MRLTDQDLQVLTNFSEIQKNFIFRKGNIATTVTGLKNIFAYYKMETEVPKEFAIYDLREFLNLYDLFDKPKLTISDDKVIFKDNRFTSEYSTTGMDWIFAPKLINNKIFNWNEFDYRFHLTANDIKDYYRCRRHTNRLPDLTIENKEGYFSLKLHNTKSKTDPKLSFILNSSDRNKTNQQFNFDMKCENFNKILIADYDAEIFSNYPKEYGGLIKLSNVNTPLTYWIALEPKPTPDTKESEIKKNAKN